MPTPASAPHAAVRRRGSTRASTAPQNSETAPWATAARGRVGLPSNVPAARLDANKSSRFHSATTVDGSPLSTAPTAPPRTQSGASCHNR